jgi:hypothetical protein
MGSVRLVLLLALLGRPDPVRLSTWPQHFAFAPCDVTVTVRIVPIATDRTLEVAAIGEAFYRASLIQLEGEDAPRTHDVKWRALPAGTYIIRAAIGSASHIRAQAHNELRILE